MTRTDNFPSRTFVTIPFHYIQGKNEVNSTRSCMLHDVARHMGTILTRGAIERGLQRFGARSHVSARATTASVECRKALLV